MQGFKEFSRIFRHRFLAYLPLLIDGKVYALDMGRSDIILDMGVLDAVTRGIAIETEKLLAEEDCLDASKTVI